MTHSNPNNQRSAECCEKCKEYKNHRCGCPCHDKPELSKCNCQRFRTAMDEIKGYHATSCPLFEPAVEKEETIVAGQNHQSGDANGTSTTPSPKEEEILWWCSRCGGKFLPLGRVLEYGKSYPEYRMKINKDGVQTEKNIPAHKEIKKALCKECAKDVYDEENTSSPSPREGWRIRFNATFSYFGGQPNEGSLELTHNNVRDFIEKEIENSVADKVEEVRRDLHEIAVHVFDATKYKDKIELPMDFYEAILTKNLPDYLNYYKNIK